jgi:ferredoxin
MKVKIDSTKCNGYGVCAGICPAVFKLDEFGFPQLSDGGAVPGAEEARAAKALSECPEHAISLAE